jgi:hypothetical protein
VEVNIEGYAKARSGNACEGYVFTNTELTSVDVTKLWVGEAADSATFILLTKNTEGVTEEIDRVTLDGSEYPAWEYTFEGLPVLENGSIYVVREITIDGYTKARSGNAECGFIFTNTFIEPDFTTIDVEKVWVGKEAEGVTFILWKDNGEEVVEVDQVTLTGAPWTHTFGPVLVEDGVTYSVTEEAIVDYATTMEGDAENGYTFTNTYEGTEVGGEQDESPKTVENTIGIILLLLAVMILSAIGIKKMIRTNR